MTTASLLGTPESAGRMCMVRRPGRVDGGVPGPDAVGELVALPGWGQSLLGWCGLVGSLLNRFGEQGAQALTVASDDPLGGLAAVMPQMRPVSDLDRLGCPGRDTFREERSSISADDVDVRLLRQPAGWVLARTDQAYGAVTGMVAVLAPAHFAVLLAQPGDARLDGLLHLQVALRDLLMQCGRPDRRIVEALQPSADLPQLFQLD